ncbi:DUF3304 domain-containing protein [Dechloromonas sp. XY25]|uniref:DUF3304 domain-containing protein n=1 Tax=Dechloromonas hankyongensis TaxID=2908002 RepID=A0ABS9K1H0_9RHOO|nr:DUF3304 domain-containing protein [Dechloromonas hankyongensis]MCG2577021.1 DUF3304 domain-containing protein [Dechloromonas hankyongensis]
MKFNLNQLNVGRRLALAMLACCLIACQPEASSKPKDEGVGVGITGINHTDKWIAEFYIEGSYGGNISPTKPGGGGGGGGKSTCCIVLPRIYQPGLKAKVRWKPTEEPYKEAEARIIPYSDGAGHAWVNFLPDGRVVIVASDMDTWSRNYHGDYRAPSHPEYRGADIEFPKQEARP